VYAPIDFIAWVSAKHGRVIPPRGLRFVGAGDFVATGIEFRDLLIEQCHLGSDSKIVDVGCGIGRLAIPLTKVLSQHGRYEGFDISKSAIRWCTKRITSRYPNFKFQHLDIANTEYNPNGAINPAGVHFPYPDHQFDCCVAMSLYTHLLEGATERYLRETVRVLRPGGIALLTFFIVNDETRSLRDLGHGSYSFQQQIGRAFVDDPNRPETAVAYEEADVVGFLTDLGLDVRIPLLWGAWSGRREYRSFQDIVVAVKPTD
jgi:SAM-dependent methyltransferase